MAADMEQTHRPFWSGILRTAIACCAVAALAGMIGCGGGGGTPAGRKPGQARFTIAWPERSVSRLIPQRAESIKLIAKEKGDEDEVILERVVPRGERVVTLDLPSVEVTVEAQARANVDGTGQVLAKGATTLQIQEMQVASAALTMDSVITSVQLTRSDVSIQEGSATQVTANAVDASGAIVLTNPSGWDWRSGSADTDSVVSWSADGATLSLTGKWNGSCAFVATEKETGRTARLTVTCTGSSPPPPGTEPGVFITPHPLVFTAGEPVTLEAFYRDHLGRVRKIPPAFSSAISGEMHQRGEGQLADEFIGITQSKGYLGVIYQGEMVNFPAEVRGYVLQVGVPWDEPGNAAEVSLDGAPMVRATPEGNALGHRMQFGSKLWCFPVQLAPGKHTIRVKNVSTGPLAPGDQIGWMSVHAVIAGTGWGCKESIARGHYQDFEFIVPGE
jgi:hypothetical protein